MHRLAEHPVQVHDLDGFGIDPRPILRPGYADSAIAFFPALRARVIDQNAAHESGGEAVKMLAVFKAQAPLPNQLQKELVDNAGGLKKILRAFAAEEGAGNFAQLRIDELK